MYGYEELLHFEKKFDNSVLIKQTGIYFLVFIILGLN